MLVKCALPSGGELISSLSIWRLGLLSGNESPYCWDVERTILWLSKWLQYLHSWCHHSMGLHNPEVSPLLTHWRYSVIVLSHTTIINRTIQRLSTRLCISIVDKLEMDHLALSHRIMLNSDLFHSVHFLKTPETLFLHIVVGLGTSKTFPYIKNNTDGCLNGDVIVIIIVVVNVVIVIILIPFLIPSHTLNCRELLIKQSSWSNIIIL